MKQMDSQSILIGLNYELKFLNAMVNQIQMNNNYEDKNEKIGETLYNFILRSVDVLNLNDLGRQDITNDIISQKLTGILLQSENLAEILYDINIFIFTLKDLIRRVYINN